MMKSAEEWVHAIAKAMAIAKMADADGTACLEVMTTSLRAIQADALEAAAKLGDQIANGNEGTYTALTAVNLAGAIRALKPKGT